jgi:hypothetical protein
MEWIEPSKRGIGGLKMTDNEIIKAIDKCLRADDCHTSECPFFDGSKDGWDCQLVALSLARDLINRQKAEIERLKGEKSCIIEH